MLFPHHASEDWEAQVLEQHLRLAHLIVEHRVPPELVFNLDQFGLKVLSLSDRTRVPVGSKSVPVIGSDDKRQITGVPVVAADGRIAGLQLIWQGKTERSRPHGALEHPKLKHSHSVNHWSTPETMRDIVTRILVPHIKRVIKEKNLGLLQKSILILDVWCHHISDEFRQFLANLEVPILVNYIPPNCTSKAQGPSPPSPLLIAEAVCDLVVNKKCKEHANDVTCAEVASKVAHQLGEMERAGSVAAVSVDIRLSALKPIVVRGMVDAVTFFETADGKALILKGFAKANVARCFERSFQEQAVAWARKSGQSVLNPAFKPVTDVPPSAAQHANEPVAIVVEESEEVLETGSVW